ncbi:MAG: DJ-1/PfpI family protein [Paraprevotella sp.]|nr:DJ-1/PfpI family protein [Paraprevotella sp.]MDD6607430.1 DJ-1/PfpI family protein [Paraprevotella sp.]MDD6758462.1 DJ-1/PfpI family protein [Paraprevotella sp.]MDD6823969.1 DJ-1/PfpI family protein [Paraprevotella sp.]
MITVFLANGFEEVEAITPVDIMRRAGLDVRTVSIYDSPMVTGAHKVPIQADMVFCQVDFSQVDLIVLPGGLPGSTNLDACEPLCQAIKKHTEGGKPVAAICAAPLVLGHLGLLVGRKATCYPGVEPELTGATCTGAMVEVDGNIITGKGPAAAFEFGYTLVEQLKSPEATLLLRDGMLYSQLLP